MSTDRISWVVVHKAVSSEETAPKPKHVRRIIIATWKTNGGGVFYEKLVQEPLTSSSLVAWKSLITIHHILQGGSPKFLWESHQKIGLFSNLESIWAKNHQAYSALVALYSRFLRDKVNFHTKNPEFDGSLTISEYVKKTEGRFDIDRSVQLLTILMNMQEDILKLQHTIFKTTPLNEARVSALIPLVKEAYNIYTNLVHHFKKLGETLDTLDAIDKQTERFYTQYINLRAFFEHASKIRYVASTIAVPMLPKDPPTFVVKGKAPRVQSVTINVSRNRPVSVQPVAVPVVQIQKQLDVHEMEAAISNATAGANPIPLATPIVNTINNQGSGGSGNDPLFLKLRTNHPSAYTPYGAPPDRKVEIPAGWVKFSSPIGGAAGHAAGMSSEGITDASEREMTELRNRLLQLVDVAQKEKEKNATLEEQLANRDAVLQKWKDAYSELLKSHEALTKEREQLIKDKEAAEKKLADYISNQEAQLRHITLSEISDAVQFLDKALFDLDNPESLGNERATPDDANEVALSLVGAIDKAVEANNGDSEVELARAIKLLGSKAGAVLLDAKGISRLTDDETIRQALFDAARAAAASCGRLLDLFKTQPDNKEAINEAAALAKKDANQIAKAIEALVAAEQMEGHASENEDLTDKASQELMKAAKIIEDAVAALTATAKARAAKPKTTPAGELDIGEAILEASLAISKATAALVSNAAQAQKEFIAAGKASPNPSTFYAKSRTFSEGMISAAQAVAAATSELVKQANLVSQGKVEEEGLIAASKAVHQATTQLVVAARVKADPNSASQKKLEEASSAVGKATQALVAAAKALAKKDEAEISVPTATGLAGSKILEMEQQMQILRLEKELNAARGKLAAIRKNEYAKK